MHYIILANLWSMVGLDAIEMKKACILIHVPGRLRYAKSVTPNKKAKSNLCRASYIIAMGSLEHYLQYVPFTEEICLKFINFVQVLM